MKKEEVLRRMKTADNILGNAEELKKKHDFDLSVRRSQEAFEIYFKTLFSVLGHEPPKKHDLKDEIYQAREILDPKGTGKYDELIAMHACIVKEMTKDAV